MKPSFHRKLDVTGLHCPLPVINCRAALASLPVGEVLYLLASDKGIEREIRGLVGQAAHVLEAQWETEGLRHFLIRKSEHTFFPPFWLMQLAGDDAVQYGYLMA